MFDLCIMVSKFSLTFNIVPHVMYYTSEASISDKSSKTTNKHFKAQEKNV